MLLNIVVIANSISNNILYIVIAISKLLSLLLFLSLFSCLISVSVLSKDPRRPRGATTGKKFRKSQISGPIELENIQTPEVMRI